MLAGLLPFEELNNFASDSQIRLQTERNVTEWSLVGFRTNAAASTRIGIDDQWLKPESENQPGLTKGIHELTLLIDLAK